MFAWITLAVILTIGTIGANANTGIIVVGSGADNQGCSENQGILDGFLGIITTSGASQFTGIIVNGAAGYYVHDAPCRTGIMIAD